MGPSIVISCNLTVLCHTVDMKSMCICACDEMKGSVSVEKLKKLSVNTDLKLWV